MRINRNGMYRWLVAAYIAGRSPRGNTWRDLAGTDHGTLVDSALWRGDSLDGINGSVLLDGVDARVTLPSSVAIRNDAPWTVAIAAKQTTLTSNKGLLSLVDAAGTACLEVFVNTSSSYKDLTWGSSTGDLPRARAEGFDVTTWGFYVISYDGATADETAYRFWRNGKEFTPAAAGAYGSVGNVSVIGRLGTSSSFDWPGNVSAVLVFDGMVNGRLLTTDANRGFPKLFPLRRRPIYSEQVAPATGAFPFQLYYGGGLIA